MCEPVTIATVSAVAIGAGISAYGQYKSGQAQEQVAKNNATMAGYQAADAKQRGAYEARDIEIAGRQAADNSRAAAVAGGIDANTGSAANIQTTSMVNAATDAAQAKANAARQAWGFKVEAQNQIAQGKVAKRAGYLGALGTGLSGLGSAAGAGAGTYTAMK